MSIAKPKQFRPLEPGLLQPEGVRIGGDLKLAVHYMNDLIQPYGVRIGVEINCALRSANRPSLMDRTMECE